MLTERTMHTEARFERLADQLLRQGHLGLTPLTAALIAASYSGYCSDSHTFSKRLGVEHALVIRECLWLADQLGALHIESQNARSQRIVYTLTDAGFDMIEGLGEGLS